jgi:hypothetical protein
MACLLIRLNFSEASRQQQREVVQQQSIEFQNHVQGVYDTWTIAKVFSLNLVSLILKHFLLENTMLLLLGQIAVL